jgi:hypothetical protein
MLRDPGHIVARASRGEHGRGETAAQCGGVEEDRRFGANELRAKKSRKQEIRIKNFKGIPYAQVRPMFAVVNRYLRLLA